MQFLIVVDFFVPWHVCLPFECSFQRALKFEGPLEINSNLSKAKRLFEGQIVGPESIAIDSTGTCKNTLTSGPGEMGGRGRNGDDVAPGENSVKCAGCIHSETLTLFPISDQNNNVISLSLFRPDTIAVLVTITKNIVCHSRPSRFQREQKPCQISHSVWEQNNWELKNQCPSKGLHIPILLVIASPVIGWRLKWSVRV